MPGVPLLQLAKLIRAFRRSGGRDTRFWDLFWDRYRGFGLGHTHLGEGAEFGVIDAFLRNSKGQARRIQREVGKRFLPQMGGPMNFKSKHEKKLLDQFVRDTEDMYDETLRSIVRGDPPLRDDLPF